MRIITTEILYDFMKRHPNTDVAIRDWVKTVSGAKWNCFADIKSTYNSVDSVGNDSFVFNVKGNKFRIIAKILFVPKMIYIRVVGTHKQYDTIKDCSEL